MSSNYLFIYLIIVIHLLINLLFNLFKILEQNSKNFDVINMKANICFISGN